MKSKNLLHALDIKGQNIAGFIIGDDGNSSDALYGFILGSGSFLIAPHSIGDGIAFLCLVQRYIVSSFLAEEGLGGLESGGMPGAAPAWGGAP